MYQQFIDEFIQEEQLPEHYRQDILQWYLPLTSELEILRHSLRPATLLLGLNGAQGTGKSTLAKLLVALLQTRGLRAVNLSLDDFYYSKAERERLAREVHPLLRSRGVPGTHNMQRLQATLDSLLQAGASTRTGLPVFDKASDDQLPDDQWRVVTGPCDIVLLEGWFVGARAQPESELVDPVNSLEADADADGKWRHYVNKQLDSEYVPVFAQLHRLLMLKAPDFDQVYSWRALQEEKLRARAGDQVHKGMNPDELRRFIQHFERLTRHCLATLPQLADTVFHLNAQHCVTHRTDRSGLSP